MLATAGSGGSDLHDLWAFMKSSLLEISILLFSFAWRRYCIDHLLWITIIGTYPLWDDGNDVGGDDEDDFDDSLNNGGADDKQRRRQHQACKINK